MMPPTNEVVLPFVKWFTSFPYLFSHNPHNTCFIQLANWHFYQCHNNDKYNLIISVVPGVGSVAHSMI